MSITKQLAGTLLCLALFNLRATALPSLSPRGANSRSFTITAIRKDDHQANGPRAYAHALAKWSANLPGDFSRVAAVASGLSRLCTLLASIIFGRGRRGSAAS
jgi:hypothetical protein